MNLASQAADAKTYRAMLVGSRRITPESSVEEVRHLVFRTDAYPFEGQVGQCLRVLAPGQFGSRHHIRLYSIAEPSRSEGRETEFTLCVRRCFYIDDFNGEQYRGVASNYLCDLKPGESIEFSGPVGYPFEVPANHEADILMIGMGTGIAPFRGLVQLIYRTAGEWKGRIRLYYGARSGLEMLYMNDENRDLALYFDRNTFKAFQAVSPRPHFDAPVALDKALASNAAETWSMMTNPDTHVYVAGPQAMLAAIEQTLAGIAGSADKWKRVKDALVASGRWNEVLY